MIKLITQAVIILIDMIVEYTNPPDSATYENLEKYLLRVSELNEIKKKLEEKT